MSCDPGKLDQLAARLGIERHITDTTGRTYTAPDETLQAIVAAMGFAAETDDDLDAALLRVEAEQLTRLISDTWCVNRGDWLCFPIRADSGSYLWTIHLEDGGTLDGAGRLEDLHWYDGEAVPSRALLVTVPVPIGVHRLVVETATRREEGTLIVAPPRAYNVDEIVGEGRAWGIMAPLYGLVSERNFGVGDFDDLARLAETAAGLGADFLGINPVHALFPEQPEAASPYSPSSRLFLNVMHIAPDRVPEFAESESARRFASQMARVLEAERDASLVDYTRVAGIKLPIFERLFSTFSEMAPSSPRRRAFEAFRADRGVRLRKQALFDALSRHFAMIGGHQSWHQWPGVYQDPDSEAVTGFARDLERDVLFYEYLQWIADSQLGDAAARAKAAGMEFGLYLDLAVGVASGGADVWASPGDYAPGISMGAPPDAFAADGQRWGLLPLNTVALRRQGFRPFIDLLRAAMRHAGIIRIDHVLGLARGFWLPDGLPGAYVRYPLHDLLAIVAIESRRANCLVIGEDLGNVPSGLRGALSGRGVLGCQLTYFERSANGDFRPPAQYRENVLASIGTHDLPPLRGFWNGCDVEARSHFDCATDAKTVEEKLARAEDRRALCRLTDYALDIGVDPHEDAEAFTTVSNGLHRQLAESPARLVALESENMLDCGHQANMPGTIDEHPNWRHLLPIPVEKYADDEGVQRLSAMMRRHRRRRGDLEAAD